MFSIKHYAYYTRDSEGKLYSCSSTCQSEAVLKGLTEATLSVELNAAGSLEITIPYGSSHYNLFELYDSELAVFQDDNEIWRGYVSEITRDFDGNKVVKAEGILAYLSMSVHKFNKNTSGTGASSFVSSLITNHNSQVNPSGNYDGKMQNRTFSVDTVNVSGTIVFNEATDYDSTWSYFENNLINAYGGFVKAWRHTNGTNKISYKKTSGETETSHTQQIKFGVNLLDLNVSYNTEDFMTMVYAKGKDANGKKEHYYTSNPITSNKAITKYGRISRFENFDGANGDSKIKIAANKKLSDAGIIYRVEANALDLHNSGSNVAAIKLGDHHSVVCAHCGLDGNNDFCVEKIDYNLLYWEESTFTFVRTEKIWVIDQDDPEYDPDADYDTDIYYYGNQDASLTRNNNNSISKVSKTAETALNKANDCPTFDEMATAISEAVAGAKTDMQTAINTAVAAAKVEMQAAINAAVAAAKTELQAPFVIHMDIDGATLRCDVTVAQFIAAIKAGKGIYATDGDAESTIQYGYLYFEGEYACVITLLANNSTYLGTGLHPSDTLVLTET